MEIKGLKRVAIIAGGPSKCLTPINEPGIDKWVLAPTCIEALPYAHRAFELHEDVFDIKGQAWADVPAEHRKESYEYYKSELRKCKCPVYMFKKFPQIPNSVEFPWKEIVERFGIYFDNSVSYMIAMAIHEGYKQIQFYGCDFHEERNYYQKGVCEFFIGMALGMGIDVVIAPGSSLLHTKDGKLYCLNKYPEEVIPEWEDVMQQERKMEKHFQELISGNFSEYNPLRDKVTLTAQQTHVCKSKFKNKQVVAI